jgi:hypothetical protein
LAEYFSAGLVALACVGAYIADFADPIRKRLHISKDRLSKVSTLVLIAALAVELICIVRTNTLAGRLTGSLQEMARLAVKEADSAESQSINASQKASDAVKTGGPFFR